MCNHFYAKGYCFNNCKRSHKKKNAGDQACWKKYLKSLLAKYKAKNGNNKEPGNGENN